MSETTPPDYAIQGALVAARKSRCRSQRGAAAWNARYPNYLAVGFNHQVEPLTCDGSAECKATCRWTAVHAEQMAIVQAGISGLAVGSDLLHVKVINGQLVPSGSPSCVHCSKLAVEAGIVRVWLFHETGWRAYPAAEFHALSAANWE